MENILKIVSLQENRTCHENRTEAEIVRRNNWNMVLNPHSHQGRRFANEFEHHHR